MQLSSFDIGSIVTVDNIDVIVTLDPAGNRVLVPFSETAEDPDFINISVHTHTDFKDFMHTFFENIDTEFSGHHLSVADKTEMAVMLWATYQKSEKPYK